jgi:hypothetical protein
MLATAEVMLSGLRLVYRAQPTSARSALPPAGADSQFPQLPHRSDQGLPLPQPLLPPRPDFTGASPVGEERSCCARAIHSYALPYSSRREPSCIPSISPFPPSHTFSHKLTLSLTHTLSLSLFLHCPAVAEEGVQWEVDLTLDQALSIGVHPGRPLQLLTDWFRAMAMLASQEDLVGGELRWLMKN